VYEGRDVAINNRIGGALLSILPDNAESITAKAIIEDDWSEVGFEYTDAAGNAGHFTHDANPDQVADEIADALDELRTLMTGHGEAAWNRSDFTAHRNGEFDVTFAYEDDPQL
jgi:Protein of unknown function, DUF600